MKTGTLWFKLVASFVVVVILSTLFMAAVIDFSTRRGFKRMVFQGDADSAAYFAAQSEDFLDQGGSVRELAEYISSISSMPDRPVPRSRGPMMRPFFAHPMPGRPIIVLTSSEGRVLASSLERQAADRVQRLPVREGVPVRSGGSVAGYLFVGTMIEPVLGPFQERFLSSVRRAALISLFFAVTLSVVLGSLLVSHITKPLGKLSEASESIAAGNFSVSLPVRRSDEIGALSRSFKTMAGELERSEQWKRQIIADSAHELRTPVGLIQGRLEMILEGLYPPSQEHLQLLYDETRRLTRLIEELQQLSSAEAGGLLLYPEVFDLDTLAAEAVHSFSHSAEEKQITIVAPAAAPHTSPLLVKADRQRIQQVISNLFSNALAAVPPEGSITLQTRRIGSGGFAEFKMTDTGPGIPETDREKVFERFYRADPSRRRPESTQKRSTGLGLAISREIIRLHGGTIGASPGAHGRGTCITFTLPYADKKQQF
jgi:signal transduction histidine kinase